MSATNLPTITNTNSQILIQAAQNLGITVELLDPAKTQLRLTKGNKIHLVTSHSFGLNPSNAIHQTHDKELTSRLVNQLGVTIPQEIKVSSPDQINHLSLNFPLVAKPVDGQKGHHVFVGIKDIETLHRTVNLVLEHYPSVLIQEFAPGTDTRFFLLNFKVIGLAQRHPPTLIADGTHSIKQLIDLHNQHLIADRQQTGRRLQNRLNNWPRLIWHLNNQGLSLDHILPNGHNLIPYPIANFQAGGTVETVPLDKLHPQLLSQAQTIAQSFGLIICGIDMLVEDLSKPPRDNVTFIEINSDPSLRLHEWPNLGTPQPVARQLLNFIFPP